MYPQLRRLDRSYFLLLPFLALTWVPVLANYWKMRYTYVLVFVWLIIAMVKRRQVRLPQKGIVSLFCTLLFLVLFSNLGLIYGLFGIGLELTYEGVADILQIFVPLAIFHLSISNGCYRELRLVVLYCFGCLFVGAIMTYLGEYEFEGGSRSLTGSSDDAQFAFKSGIGAYGFVYGTGLLVVPLLHGMALMTLWLKLLLSTLIFVILMAVYSASYSILIIAMALAGTLYLSAKIGFKRHGVNLLGVVLVALLVATTAVPQTLSFLAEPIRSLSFLTTNKEYQNRITAVSDAMSGAEGTYAEQRASLYWDSWRVFLTYPVFGGGSGDTRRPARDYVGGHSTIFDTLGFYGLFGLMIYILFFICHYRYMRVMSFIHIGNQWWLSYVMFLFSAFAVMCINPLGGPPLLYNLCLFIPSLPLFYKNKQGLVDNQGAYFEVHQLKQRDTQRNGGALKPEQYARKS